MIYCQFQMVITDYSLDMFRASLCPSSREKTTCYCIWGIFAVTREDADISRVVNKSSILLHLVGILSSRFAHHARSQEHKAS